MDLDGFLGVEPSPGRDEGKQEDGRREREQRDHASWRRVAFCQSVKQDSRACKGQDPGANEPGVMVSHALPRRHAGHGGQGQENDPDQGQGTEIP